jgi:putative chitinase
VITLDELHRIYPLAGKRCETFLEPLNAAMVEWDISPFQPREMAFLAQIGHESGQLLYVRELASGAAYECRADLGNTEPGDGIRYKGRGLIQITGRANYRDCGEALGLDLIAQPELLELPVNACRSAGWFWKTKGLNELADKGNFILITKRINGGTNGWSDRLALFNRAQQVLA